MNHAYAFGFISLFVLGGATAFTACSSSSGDNGPGITDSGTGNKDTGSATDSGVTTDTGSSNTDTGPVGDTGGDDTADGGCSTIGTLHPPSPDAGTSTIYCPFSATDGGTNVYCTGMTQHCCETPAGTSPSTCEDLATACSVPKSTDWQCQDPVADCPSAKPICCAAGASIGLGTPGCGNFAHKMTGTACVATGGCTGIIMCTSDGECPTGQHCTPFSKAGAQVGGCM